MSVEEYQSVGEYPPLSGSPIRVIDLAAARIGELEAQIEFLKALNDRQTDRLAVWIGREAAES
jgi:hypothetical protein